MVRDVYSKLDVLNTASSCGAPNFRQAKGGYSVFGMGQPSLNGFKQVLQKLQSDGHKVCSCMEVKLMHKSECKREQQFTTPTTLHTFFQRIRGVHVKPLLTILLLKILFAFRFDVVSL